MTTSSSDAVQLVRSGESYTGKQGLIYRAGVSGDTVGSRGLCVNVLTVPPGGRAKAHYHEGIETVAYLMDGECVVYHGDGLAHRLLVRPGDFVYLPADVPHAPANESGAPCTWLVAHSAATDQEGIVMLPELDPPG